MRKVAYTVHDVAGLMGLHPNTVRKMLRDGRLERIPNTGRAVRIAAAEVESVFGVDLTERGAA